MSVNGSNNKSLESWIWDAACSNRGAKQAPKYKDYILPLIFVKSLQTFDRVWPILMDGYFITNKELMAVFRVSKGKAE
jgi:hypothetical protein